MPTAAKKRRYKKQYATGTMTPAKAQLHAQIDQARAGCRASMTALIEKYHPLLHKLSKRIRSRGMDREDLYQLAALTFMEAVQRYDPTRAEFITFLYLMIPHRLQRLAAEDGVIRLPCQRRPKYDAEYTAAVGGVFGLEIGRVGSGPGKSEDTNTPLSRELSPEGAAMAKETDDDIAAMRQALRRLPERQREILFLWSRGGKLSDIGDHLGVSKERVRQIKLRALRRVRELMEKQNG